MRNGLLGFFLMLSWMPSAAADWCNRTAGEFSFEATFEGDSLPGEFREFDVRLSFDPEQPSDGELRVEVDLGAADMGDPDMNAVLFDPEWFDVERYENATFVSDSIRAQDDEHFVADGTLDLKGRERPVSVPFSWQQSDDTASMQGALELNRTEFDVGSGEWSTGESIGLTVRLAFDLALTACDGS